MKKKLKALRKASTKNKIIKPVKAFTGMEIAAIAALAGAAGSQFLGDKPKATSFKDPFKQYDPAMTPAEYVAKQTSASGVAGAVPWTLLRQPVNLQQSPRSLVQGPRTTNKKKKQSL
jgi:hypothetical protein